MKIYRHLFRFKAVSVFSIGLLLSLCAVSKAQAQSQEDSLLKVLSGLQVDSLKADVLIQLSSASLGSDPEKSENYARRALQHSEPVGYYKGVAGAYRYLGLVQYNQSQYKEAFGSWLNALAMYDSVGDKANMARMYSNLAAIYESQSIDDRKLTRRTRHRNEAAAQPRRDLRIRSHPAYRPAPVPDAKREPH